MSTTVTILGTSGMFATMERACAGYLLELDGGRIWMDAGAGTWQRLIAHIDYHDLNGIILSHRHPDHITDVFQVFHARHYGDPEPCVPIPLWAPAETIDRILMFSSEFSQAFDVHPVKAGDSFEIGNHSFSFYEMAHPVETVGVRIQDGDVSLAYSSDTGPGGDFDGLATNADVLLCEATLQDSDEAWDGHMQASQAAQVAERVGARKLVLTHLPPGRDLGLSIAEAERAANGLDIQLASDGLRLQLAP